MGSVALTIFVLFAVFALAIFLVSRWAINYVQRVMVERVEAVDQIVNQGRVPEVWIKRYVAKIDNLKEKPGSQKVIARYVALAQKRCIANLDELIRFTEQTKYNDSDDAKRHLMASLREQRERWEDMAFWKEVFS